MIYIVKRIEEDLDFGCGSGRDTKYFLDQGYQVTAIDGSAERGKKRSDYRYIAKYLKWMMRYPGGREKAVTLAETYRKQYPRRSAMLDELRGI